MGRRAALLAGGAVGFCLGVAVAFLWLRSGRETRSLAARGPAPPPSSPEAALPAAAIAAPEPEPRREPADEAGGAADSTTLRPGADSPALRIGNLVYGALLD